MTQLVDDLKGTFCWKNAEREFFKKISLLIAGLRGQDVEDDIAIFSRGF
mgnify:CR=1 FL=1